MRYLTALALFVTACGGSPAPEAKLGTPTELNQVDPCNPGEILCDGDTVARCGADGTTREAVLDCTVNAQQTTCGACAAGPACVSRTPLCSGTLTGLGDPWVFSDSGCGTVQCEANVAAAAGGKSLGFTLGGGPLAAPMTIAVGDLSQVIQGANAASQVHLTGPCSQYVPGAHFGLSADGMPPRPDDVRLSWTGIKTGDSVAVDIDVYLDCRTDAWTHVVAHVDAVLQ